MIRYLFNRFGYYAWMAYKAAPSYITRFTRETCYMILNWKIFGSSEIERTNVCEDIGSRIYNAEFAATLSIFALIVPPAIFWGRSKWINAQYDHYQTKNDGDINKLSTDQAQAFHFGVDTNLGYSEYLLYGFRLNAWRHPRAFYAGFVAGSKENDNEAKTLIGKITKR